LLRIETFICERSRTAVPSTFTGLTRCDLSFGPKSGRGPARPQQLHALAASMGRELGWGLRGVRAELSLWRARADAIPDPGIREHALAAMADGRLLVDGAAVFWTLPSRRRPELLRLLVAFQTLLNFFDLALEREPQGSDQRPGSWTWLVRGALDLNSPLPDREIKAQVGDDGGYLSALVMACRDGCALLPNYRHARELLIRETTRSQALEIEHDRDVSRRNEAMQAHVAQHFSGVTGMTWWEIAGGASALLGAMVVLALAADEAMTADDFRQAADAYVWVAGAAALLDSYADRPDDVSSGSHNWFDYYATDEHANRRVAEVLQGAVSQVLVLRNGERHVVIVASMAALSLSSDAARRAEVRDATAVIARGGGGMTRLLIPVLRAWRVAYGRTAN
jgi:tetraprenyl-beta-curcumene synthase